MTTLLQRLAARIKRRAPDFIIGGEADPYMLRWWVIPRNPIFNVYLHEFRRSDDDRALHDHPWLFNCSVLVEGMYWEHTPQGCLLCKEGGVKFRWGRAPHRVELYYFISPEAGERPCTTFFITGPRVRGWVHWKKFTAPNDKGQIGPGCGS